MNIHPTRPSGRSSAAMSERLEKPTNPAYQGEHEETKLISLADILYLRSKQCHYWCMPVERIVCLGLSCSISPETRDASFNAPSDQKRSSGVFESEVRICQCSHGGLCDFKVAIASKIACSLYIRARKMANTSIVEGASSGCSPLIVSWISFTGVRCNTIAS